MSSLIPRPAVPAVFGLAWTALAAIVWRDQLGAHLIQIIAGLGLVTAVPLGLRAAATGALPSRFRTVAELTAQPLGVVAAPSLLLDPGVAAALLAAAWIVPCVATALWGAGRLLQRGPWPLEEVAIDAGLVYLPVAAAWLVAGRLGATPLGFVEPIVTLTAVHFTYAGFGGAIVAGALGRIIAAAAVSSAVRKLYAAGAATAIAAVPLVALGIWLSPGVEVVAAIALAAGLVALALVGLGPVQRLVRSSAARTLIAASSSALLFSMACAVIYAVGEVRGAPLLSIAEMVDLHGLVNALAFVIAGLFGAVIAAPAARYTGTRAPLSQLDGGGRIGADFFDRAGAVVGESNPPRGLIDSLNDYARPQLNPSFVDLAIRRFYERTGDYAIAVVPRWAWYARPAAALFRRFARRAGQLGLPFDPVADSEMESRLAWLRSSVDGRNHPRAWVRTYIDSGEVVYTAAYVTHVTDGMPYMNIAFPLPGGNMTSVLRVDFHGGGGLAVTTLPDGRERGDEGIFWVRKGRPFRLPINETIYVVARREAKQLGLGDPPKGTGRVTVVARHDLWVFGLKVLELEYWLTPRSR